MNKEPIFTWHEQAGTATCEIKYKGQIFIGGAFCHPDDKDMMNRRTGEEIAYRRAKIKMLCCIRDNEVKPALAALEHLQACMIHSKHYDENSYENYMLRKSIQRYKNDLTTIKEMLAEERVGLKLFLTQKDAYYKQIRARRQKANSK